MAAESGTRQQRDVDPISVVDPDPGDDSGDGGDGDGGGGGRGEVPEGVKESLQDPQGRLSSWSFSNSSVGFICNFVGVSCWNLQENRVLSLELSSMGLAGGIPSALQLCSSITHLVLSGNALTGKIPSELCQWLPNLVYLDLSGNRLSGEIPPELADCAYLNTLFLSGNELSGAIPSRLSELRRLRISPSPTTDSREASPRC
ncbi:unnamed protein product [Spirodela intermedia]|uniref:Leucine-rich repeat-containing N-terminal plant-type domain-containing protein n=1 Tax=Spirodela intermedia TaxID=51605 RepID=A0A7I8JKB0_SPIIN|nr:unnamed protein product [Spirodela intermedia]CAA6670617.1 unnamed protein product [Spirodela intermedia]